MRLRTLLLGAATLAACSAPPLGDRGNGAARLTPLPPVATSVEIARAMRLPEVRDPPERHADFQLADATQSYVTDERLERGYTLVVVGVNGDNMLSAGLAPGIVEGGYPGAVEVIDWTTGFWPLFVYHLRADKRHRTAAEAIAEKIAAYRAHYPGREVNLVGYSAGAVVAVEAVEALPPGGDVDRVVLLAGAISPAYDLRVVLQRCRQGVWSYYQPQDLVALWAGTLVAGTADGCHTPSAGAIGFWTPSKLDDQDRQLYRDKLIQMPFQPQMIASGNLGGHFQCVGRKFVAEWIAPVLTDAPRIETATDTRRDQHK